MGPSAIQRGKTPGCHASAGQLPKLDDGHAGRTDGGFFTCCASGFDSDEKDSNGKVVIANAGGLARSGGGRDLAIDSALLLGQGGLLAQVPRSV